MWLIDGLITCGNVIKDWGVLLWNFLETHYLFVIIFSGTSLVLSIVGCAILITFIPADYFDETKQIRPIQNPFLRILVSIIKNLIGGILIVFGALLALPGIPGQGLLTILSGLIISDFPGKKKLARRIIRIPAVQLAANKIRTSFNRPTLILSKNEILDDNQGQNG